MGSSLRLLRLWHTILSWPIIVTQIQIFQRSKPWCRGNFQLVSPPRVGGLIKRFSSFIKDNVPYSFMVLRGSYQSIRTSFWSLIPIFHGLMKKIFTPYIEHSPSTRNFKSRERCSKLIPNYFYSYMHFHMRKFNNQIV